MRGDAREERGDQDIAPPGYPLGFGAGGRERDALFKLSTLRGMTPRKLHALAWDVGSAETCLDAVRAGRAGSPADQQTIGEAQPGELRRRLAACGAVLVGPYDPGYPDVFNDLLHDPPA